MQGGWQFTLPGFYLDLEFWGGKLDAIYYLNTYDIADQNLQVTSSAHMHTQHKFI